MNKSLTNFKTFEDNKKSLDDKIDLLERYVLAEDKESFFKTLVFNSETYLYMKMNDMINNNIDLSSILTGDLKTYFDEVANSLKLEILFKDLVRNIPKEQDAEKRKALIKRFNDEFLHISFGYSKPVNIKKSEGITTIEEAKLESSITAAQKSKWTVAHNIKEYLTSDTKTVHSKFSMLTPDCYHALDLNAMINKSDFSQVETVLQRLPHFFNFPKIEETLALYISKKSEVYKTTVQIHSSIYPKLPLQSLHKLGELVKPIWNEFNFVGEYTKKKFEKLLRSPADSLSFEEASTLLVELQKFADGLDKSHNQLSDAVIKERVSLNIRNNKFDKTLFVQYLNSRQAYSFGHYTEAHNLKIKSNVLGSNNFSSIHGFNQGGWHSVKDVIDAHLENFFENGQKIEDWASVFHEKYVKEIFYRTKLYQGEKIPQISDIFTEIALNTMKDKRELTFDDSNVLVYKKGQPIKLRLKLKNIQNLTVRIFEIETKKFYQQNNTATHALMDLTGLTPALSFSREFEKPPIVIFYETFEIKELDAVERGIFIVEFIAEGLKNVALIRKGNLNMIKESGNNGHEFYILDEERNALTGEETTLTIKEKVYKADSTGKILVPYLYENINNNVIITHKNFSELVNLRIDATNVQLDTALIFNEESLNCNNQATFILQPKLFATNRLLSLSLLKNIKVMITSVNYKQVKHSKIWEDGVKFEDGEDFLLDYVLPPKTNSIEIRVIANIVDPNTEKEISLKITKTIHINRKDNEDVYYEMFLKQEKDKYKIKLLGKNGETYGKYNIAVSVTVNFIQQKFYYSLETDQNGEIHLGDLPNVSKIDATLQSAPGNHTGLYKSWNINSKERFNNFPQDFDIPFGEDL